MKVLRLNRALVLEARVETPDGAGGQDVAWVGLGTLWADVRPGTGREAGDEATALGEVALRITVKGAPVGAPSRPVPGQRFREASRIFRILAVIEADPEARHLVCFAREEVAA